MATAKKRSPAVQRNGQQNGQNSGAVLEVDPIIQQVIITPLRTRILMFRIIGTAPYMQCRFAEKSMNKIKATQEAGQQARSKKQREARDFQDDYEQATHKFDDGRCGIPATAFRNALISACRLCGFKMTIAKLTIFIEADGLDMVDGTPLVEIDGEREMNIGPVRNASGVVDLRARPLWREWHATLRVRFDLDQFSSMDVLNLLVRAGGQVGIGEGRPDSRDSAGIGYGLFEVEPFDREDVSVEEGPSV